MKNFHLRTNKSYDIGLLRAPPEDCISIKLNEGAKLAQITLHILSFLPFSFDVSE